MYTVVVSGGFFGKPGLCAFKVEILGCAGSDT